MADITKPIINPEQVVTQRSDYFKSLGNDGTSWRGPLVFLGFDDVSVQAICRARDKLEINIQTRGKKPGREDLFTIAAVNTVLALAGYDVEKESISLLSDEEIGTMRRYQGVCRTRIRKKNDIDEEVKCHDAFGAVQQIAKQLFDKCTDLVPLKNIVSSKVNRWMRITECKYCGKEISTKKEAECYCDDICEKLKKINKEHALFYRVNNIGRLNDVEYKEVITDPLASYNAKYTRNVSSKELVTTLKEMVDEKHLMSKEAFYFYAYYISARRNKSTYITYLDMMAKAGENFEKWHGIKSLMLEKEACKMENRVSGIFKMSLKNLVKANVIPAAEESGIFASFDAIDMNTIQFRSHPKTVAVTVLYAILEIKGITFERKSFCETTCVAYSTIWKKIGAAKKMIANPDKYRKSHDKKEMPEKVLIPAVLETVPSEPVEEPFTVKDLPEEIPSGSVVVKEPPKEAVTVQKTVLAQKFVTADDLELFKQGMLAEILKLSKPAPVVVEKKAEVIPERRNGTVYVGMDKKKETSGHAIYVDMNNLYYIAKKQLGIRFDMEKFVNMLNVALIAIDDKYDEKSIISAHVYIGKQLQGLKNVFDGAFSACKTKDISGSFTWWWPTERKFENNVEKEQDIDTFLVADAVEEMIINREKITHVVLGSSDKDLVPVLERARKMGMKTSVIGYRKYTPAPINALATKVYYLD